jgi:hypothetical protein
MRVVSFTLLLVFNKDSFACFLAKRMVQLPTSWSLISIWLDYAHYLSAYILTKSPAKVKVWIMNEINSS